MKNANVCTSETPYPNSSLNMSSSIHPSAQKIYQSAPGPDGVVSTEWHCPCCGTGWGDNEYPEQQ